MTTPAKAAPLRWIQLRVWEFDTYAVATPAVSGPRNYYGCVLRAHEAAQFTGWFNDGYKVRSELFPTYAEATDYVAARVAAFDA